MIILHSCNNLNREEILQIYTEPTLPVFRRMQRTAFRIMLSSCVCVCVFVCVCVCAAFVDARKTVEIETSVFFEWREMIPDIICKSLIQIGLQIPRWRTKWRS